MMRSIRIADGFLRFTLTILAIISFSASAWSQCGGGGSPSVTTSSLPNGSVGTAYSAQLSGSGGTPPYTWSISQGALPPGLTIASLSSTTGQISGTPTTGGTFTFRVRATNSGTNPKCGEKDLSIKIPPTITTTSLANGVAGLTYSQTLTATQSATALTWSVTAGNLPAGLALSPGGMITGTPTTNGTSNFTVTVTDASSPPLVGSKPLSIAIAPLTITTTSPLPPAAVGSSYVQTLSANAQATWSIINRVLPPGLSLSANGTISGTPTTGGTFDFTVQAQAGSPTQTATADLRIVVTGTALTITTPSPLPSAVVGTSYSLSLTATGGTPPYTWTPPTTGMPNGLTLSSAGVLSGAPTSPGSFSFTVTVSDSSSPLQTATRTFSMSVSNPASPPAITTSTLPGGAVGKSYSQTLAVSGGVSPYTWTLPTGVLPGGLTLSSGGTISGTPTASGTFNFTVTVADSATTPQTASKAFSIVIQQQLTITTPTNLPLAVVGVFYSVGLEATGPAPLTWTVISGIAPPGVSLTSGNLAGTPTVAGTFDFTVQTAGGDPAQTATQPFHIVVNEALRITTVVTLRDAMIGVPYTTTLEAVGGLPPYTWTNPTGRPLFGLSLSTSGVISGTPTALGDFTFTAQVADSFTPIQQASRTFALTITSGVTITTQSLPPATVNVAYSQTLQALGNPPLTWVVANGTLPTGLILTPAGVLQGTPTATGSQAVTIRLTDARGTTATRDFTIVVDPPIPSLSVTGLLSSLTTRQTFDIPLTLATPHPSSLNGTLKLTFSSNAEVPGDDPATQFSNGSRMAIFTIPAGTTAAVFPSKLMLLTGTVVGTVRLTAAFENGPTDVPVATVDIPTAPPQFTDVKATRTVAGLSVQITGFAPSRRVARVEFTFDVKNGDKTEPVGLTRSVDSEFADWYRNSASTAFGSSFSFLQSFSVGGDVNAIVGVTVRLTNAQGSNTSATVAPK